MKEAKEKKMHTVSFYFYKLQTQTNLFCGVRSQDAVEFGEGDGAVTGVVMFIFFLTLWKLEAYGYTT